VELGILLTSEVRRPRDAEQRRSASSSDVNTAWRRAGTLGLGWLCQGGRAPQSMLDEGGAEHGGSRANAEDIAL
jgi:hypothetical protein